MPSESDNGTFWNVIIGAISGAVVLVAREIMAAFGNYRTKKAEARKQEADAAKVEVDTDLEGKEKLARLEHQKDTWALQETKKMYEVAQRRYDEAREELNKFRVEAQAAIEEQRSHERKCQIELVEYKTLYQELKRNYETLRTEHVALRREFDEHRQAK